MEDPQMNILSSGNETKEAATGPGLSRYGSQKKRDWKTFGQYLKNHRPPLELPRCSGAHVLEFLRHLDQFGKTKVHSPTCPFFGRPAPPVPCPCPLRQAWGSLDALVGRLRAAFEENGGRQESNPFGAHAVRLYLREVREQQARARGISYKKRRKCKSSSSKLATSSTPPRPPPPVPAAAAAARFYYEQVVLEPGFYHHLDEHFLIGAPDSGGEEISFSGGSILSYLSAMN